MSTVNYFEARRSNLAAFNAVRLNVSTITGSTIQTSATATTSSFVVSTITTQVGSYSTLSGSSLSATSLQIQSGTYSTLSGSSLSASSMTSNTLNTVSTITTSSLRTTGNVGIGTTNPSSLLTVHGGNTSTAITVANGFNAGNYSRYGLAYSASQYSNHSAAGDTVINSVGGNMILEAVNKNISLSVPNTVCPNLLTVSGTGSSQTSSTAGWGSLTNTFKYSNIALTWTAPVACYVSSVSMYLGQGNNGTNISMYLNGNFINEWWPFQGYGLYVINATGSSTANGSATTPTPFSAMGQTLLQPGQTLVIYVSSLQAYNYFYYGHDSTTGGIGFSVVYAVPKVDLSLSTSSPALSLGMMNVGVGTSSPIAVLDVNGSFRVLSKAYTALTSGTGVDIIYSGGGTLTSGTRAAGGALTAAAMSYAASGHTWYVGSSAGTNAMTVASTGSVGIGITNPFSKLNIAGGNIQLGSLAEYENGTTCTEVIQFGGGYAANWAYGYAGIQGGCAGAGGGGGFGGILNFWTKANNGSTYSGMTLNQGNVGVGTTTPVSMVSVYGSSTAYSGLINIQNTATVGASSFAILAPNLIAGQGHSMVIGQNTSPNNSFFIFFQYVSAGSASNYLCFSPYGSGAYSLVITNSNYVGIGTATPSYALDVVGSSRVSGSILFGFGGTYAAGCIYTDSNWGCIIRAKTVNPAVGAFLFSNSADTHLMTITNSGFVGIGTDTPPSWGQTTICGAGNSVNSSNQLVLMNSTNNNMVLMLAMGTTAAYIQSYQQGTPGGSTLCLNQLGGNVGIGLTNPSYLLHVAGSLNCSSLYVDGVAITSLGAQWTESGSNAYYTAGSIGIGTTSPSNLLTVAQLGANYSAPVLVLDAGIAANASAGAPRGIGAPLLGIGNSSWTSGGAAGDYYGIGFGYGGATSGSFYPAEIGLYVQTTSGSTWGDMVFSTRSTTANNVASERMRITGAGNVGIGTTNPSFPLSLVGAQSINGTSSQYSKTTSSGNLLFNTSSDSYAYPTMNLFNYDHNNNGIFFDIIYTTPNWQNCTTGTNWGIYKTGGLLQFTYLTGTAGTTGDLTNAMVLTSSGVGIGTTNPSGTLHAYGNAVVANYRPYLFSHFTVSRSSAAASMAIVAGTESTTATLYLGTPLAPGGSSSSAYKVCILANGNGSGSGWSTADLHFCLNHSTGGSSNDIANTASISDSKMVIKTYGNVGIGTVDPSAKLHVNGATFIQGPTVGTTTTNVIGNFGLRISQLTSAQETVGQIVGQMCFHGWGRPNASSFIRCITDATNGYDDAGALVFGTSNAGTGAVEAMRITEAGNVGIGMSNPAYRLDVAGTLNCTGLYVNGSAFTGGSGATWTVSGSNAYYSSGNIGIGTNSPGAKLDVYSSATNQTAVNIGVAGEAYSLTSSAKSQYYTAGTNIAIYTTATSTNNGCLIDLNAYNSSNGATNVFFGAAAGPTGNGPANFVIGRRTGVNSWAESVRVDTSGNLGIGTNAPTENLTVYGSAIGLRNSSIGVFSIGLATGSGQYSSSAVAADSIIRSMNGNLMLQTGSGAAALYINSSTNYVGIGTTTPSTALTVVGSMTTHGQLFAVGGNTSTYYPVLIDASPSWTTSNTYKFTVSRSSVHMDASWKGATTIIVEGHNYSWGNGADFLKYKIIGSTSGPVSWGNFVANIFEDPNSAFIVIYLRGDTTYYFTGEGCLLNNANASGATLTVPAGSYNASYAATTTVTAPFGSLVVSGDYRDNIWSVGGNVGIGKSNPSQLLDVNGAINCTSFLVNGTAVATGTGSVWGVNGSAAYYTSGLVGIGTNNPLTTNQIGGYGGNGMDVWSTTAFDAWAKIRILCNASQYGRTTLEMIGRWEGNNDGWTLNGGRNNIVFGYQTYQGSAITYVNAIQSFNGQMGFFSSGYSSATPAMVLNASGYVGIGTASPAVSLHVFGNSTAGHLNRIQIEGNINDVACLNLKTAANTSYIFTDGNGHLQLYPNTAASQYVFIQPDPSGKVAIGNNGNTPYGMLQVGHANTASGSSDGNIVFGKSNGSGFRYFKMGYDADFNFSIGDYGHAAGLVWTQQLKLAYSAPANCIVVNSSGFVGIGTTTMSASLHVYGTGINMSGQNVPFCIANSNNGKRWDVGPNSGAGDFIIYYNNAGVWLNNLNPAAGWNYSSDLRLKDDIVAIPNCMDTIDALRPVSYRMKSNMDSQYKTFGLIAQEVKEVLPELVHSIHDAEHGEIYGITYNGFIPILIGAVKELSAENATLQAANAATSSQMAALQAENAQLTSQVASLLAWAQTQGFSG